jgi:hypothetical protein
MVIIDISYHGSLTVTMVIIDISYHGSLTVTMVIPNVTMAVLPLPW